MTARTHPFRSKGTLAAWQEKGVFLALRAFTYIILLFGVTIFSIIIYKGAPAVFTAFRFDSHLPFVHNDFLFTKPQTLHVFTYQGKIRKMSADEFYAFTGQLPDSPATSGTTPAAAPGTDQAAPALPDKSAANAVPPGAKIDNATHNTAPASPDAPAAAAAPTPAAATATTPAVSPATVAPTAPILSTTGVNPADILDHQTYSYAAGGIFPQIVGTILLVLGSMTIALILGIFSAVYLSEYSKQGPVIHAIRLAIINLAGVPSIVFGLFGVGLFVIAFHWNVSLMAGWFTLAFMVLPVIITASEESLRAVPQGFRQGSLALGATKWQTIWQNVLPYALPGILTSSVLGIARVAGETAPILFTAAYATSDKLPWDITGSTSTLSPGLLGYLQYPFVVLHHLAFSGVNALPYHIYVVSSKIPQNEYTERVQYGTAFVFLAVVMSIALASILLRLRLRNRLKW